MWWRKNPRILANSATYYTVELKINYQYIRFRNSMPDHVSPDLDEQLPSHRERPALDRLDQRASAGPSAGHVVFQAVRHAASDVTDAETR